MNGNRDFGGVLLGDAGRHCFMLYRRGFVPILPILAAVLLLSSCVNPLLKLKPASVSPPIVSPGGGVFGTDQSVTLSGPSGSTIYYTTDGTAPTTSSTKYSNPIPVAGNGTQETIEAIATVGGKESAVVSAAFTINYSIGGTSTLAPPTFSPVGGNAPNNQLVTITGPSGASVYYTTNGTTPSASNGTLYTAPFAISGADGTDVTIRAVSVESGLISSPVVSAGFVITYSADTVVPTITINVPSGGTIGGSNLTWIPGASPSVTITGGTTAATYYYVVSYDDLNPSAPTTSSSSATGPSATILLSPPDASYHTVTVAVMAEDPSTTPGPVAESSWYLNESVPKPTLSLVSGRYSPSESTTMTVSYSDTDASANLSVTSGTTSVYLVPTTATGPTVTTLVGTASPIALPSPLSVTSFTVTASETGWVSAQATGQYTITSPKISVASTSERIIIPAVLPTSASSVTSLIVKLWGAGGGGGFDGEDGGAGGFAESTLGAAAGQIYDLWVGSGGAAGTLSLTGGGGGGMTVLDQYSTSASNYTPLLIAGGGGGGGTGAYPVIAPPGPGGAGGAQGRNGGGSYVGADGGRTGSNGTGGAGGIGVASGGAPATAANIDTGGNGSTLSLSATTTPLTFTNGGTGSPTGTSPYGHTACGGSGGSGYGGGGAGGVSETDISTTLYAAGGGGGGGGSYGQIVVAGSGITPGDATDIDLPTGYAVGGGYGSSYTGVAPKNGGSGYAVVYLN